MLTRGGEGGALSADTMGHNRGGEPRAGTLGGGKDRHNMGKGGGGKDGQGAPGKMGLPRRSSAMTHPTDHTSMAAV